MKEYIFLESLLPKDQLLYVSTFDDGLIPLKRGLLIYAYNDILKVKDIHNKATQAQEKGTLTIRLPEFSQFYINQLVVTSSFFHKIQNPPALS